jgi:Kef-type K+ transport system membrane component KefB
VKGIKNSLFYIITIGAFSLLVYWIVLHGSALENPGEVVSAPPVKSQWDHLIETLLENIKHPLAILLAQIITIIIAARIFGWVFKKIGQPTVIGEIIAGIVLGPSVVGMHFPEFSAALFPTEPKDAMDGLKFMSQIGLILFMFVVGMELELKSLKSKAREAIIISHSSIIVPFALGMILAYFMYDQYSFANVPFLSFGLFMGIAMSITAFPVLARIIQERGIHKSKLGMMAIACAAADDLTAWCILAAVIAIVKAGSFESSLFVIAMSIGYVIIMINVVRPFLKRVGDLHATRENLSKPIVAIFFLTLIISAYATEVIGIHALFGAFMAGAIMPDNAKFRSIFIEKIEDVALVLLLPLFFVFTGLRTKIGLLDSPDLWWMTAWIVALAIAGKFLGSALAAKFAGQSWKDSLTIGALMNTRGLMELVVLNIGYDLKVLTPTVFTMLVIMALVTTFMTGPVLDLINWVFKEKSPPIPQEISNSGKFRILVSFGNPERGINLLRLANAFVKKMKDNASVTMMHLSLSNELNQFNVEESERESFAKVIDESKRLGQKITTFYKATVDIDSDITEVANKGDYDLLIIGVGQSIFEGTLLGRILGYTTRIINPNRLIDKVTGKEKLFETPIFDERTQLIVNKSKVPLGIFIDRDMTKIERVFLPVFSKQDAELITFAQKLINNNNSQVTVLDAVSIVKNDPEVKENLRRIEQLAPNHISLLSERKIEREFIGQQDLMLISADSWKQLVDSQSVWLNNAPSVLIIKEA